MTESAFLEAIEKNAYAKFGLDDEDREYIYIEGKNEAASACLKIARQGQVELLEGMKFKPGHTREATIINHVIDHQIAQIKALMK